MNKTSCNACSEYRTWSRRQFLIESRTAAAKVLLSHAAIPKIALSRDHVAQRDVLVVVFLRGGMDGLTSVVPYGDPNLYDPQLRPHLAVMPPQAPNGAIDLDGFFGLAPAMGALLPAYQSGQLAIVHATGSPDPTRSHFDAFTVMEYGAPQQFPAIATGWLARHLQLTPPQSASPLRAVAIADMLPQTLEGAPATLPIPQLAQFNQMPGHPDTAALRQQMLASAYTLAGEPLSSIALSTLGTVDLLSNIDFEHYAPAGGATYPNTDFGQSMRAIAALIKAEVGLEAAMTEQRGWDTHNAQGVFDGDMSNLMRELSGTLAAFHLDMQNSMNRLTLLVMSEFGRRADENGSLGTDHGHGNCMFVMGGHIAGGRVLADWTGGQLLHPDLRYEGDSLDVTIDYRDIVAEVLKKRLRNNHLPTVFPNYTPTFRGITT